MKLRLKQSNFIMQTITHDNQTTWSMMNAH